MSHTTDKDLYLTIATEIKVTVTTFWHATLRHILKHIPPQIKWGNILLIRMKYFTAVKVKVTGQGCIIRSGRRRTNGSTNRRGILIWKGDEIKTNIYPWSTTSEQNKWETIGRIVFLVSHRRSLEGNIMSVRQSYFYMYRYLWNNTKQIKDMKNDFRSKRFDAFFGIKEMCTKALNLVHTTFYI